MFKNMPTRSVSIGPRIATLAASFVLITLPMAAQSAPGNDRVFAQAQFTSTLDAKTLKPGANFTVKLDSRVHLANGTVLPAGTVLHGTVVDDDLNVAGDKKLALRFTSADVKGGQSISIRATMLGLREEADINTSDPNEVPSGSTVGVDRVGTASGVDLHSRFASENSGVLVATGKSDVKLKVGSAVDLAIAAEPGAKSAAQAGN